ncbi:phage tail protein [Hyalangium sp.]|uniref:phage tail protein n=1 Tax=Hyalangium sp. TaxID=2028555 RepID=UPI002D6C5E7B|nr:phage tail protein [Hyalangium sp.]HYH96170.1 phage tail protein [Hyalangium sp.]
MDIKAKLTGAQWRIHLERTLNIDGEEVPVIIRRPPEHLLMSVLDAAQKAGEVDKEHKPVSEFATVRLMARIVATCLFAPGGLRPMFSSGGDLDTVLQAPWLMEVQQDCMSAIGHAVKLTDVAKDFSEATPT